MSHYTKLIPIAGHNPTGLLALLGKLGKRSHVPSFSELNSSSGPLIPDAFGFSRLHEEKTADHVENRTETEPSVQEHFGTDHHGRGLAFHEVTNPVYISM